VVAAVTNGRLNGRALLTRTFGIGERIFSGQGEWLARESRRPAEAEAGAGQDHRGVVSRATLSVLAYGADN
jgi:hypothetical protein